MENVTFFSNPYFFHSIIGITNDNRLVYDYDKMIESYIEEEGLDMNNQEDVSESIEWIETNTLRTLPYMGSNKPEIVFPLNY